MYCALAIVDRQKTELSPSRCKKATIYNFDSIFLATLDWTAIFERFGTLQELSARTRWCQRYFIEDCV